MAAVKSYVVDEQELDPVRENGDTASVRVAFDASNGCERLEQRLIRYGRGRSAEQTLVGKQEVWFVGRGRGVLPLDGPPDRLEPDTGVYLAPGEAYAVENEGPDELRILS